MTTGERYRCLDCGCFVPTETVEGGKAAEYDDWAYTVIAKVRKVKAWLFALAD